MDTYLQHVVARIIRDLESMRTKRQFNPGLYIGKTADFNDSAERHFHEGYPILLRIAEGAPEEISALENALIEQFQKDSSWNCFNENKGSGGNPFADKLYVCFNSSVESDELYEMDEVLFLGCKYPLDLKKWRE